MYPPKSENTDIHRNIKEQGEILENIRELFKLSQQFLSQLPDTLQELCYTYNMTSKEHTQEVTHSRRDLESPSTIYRVQRYDHYTIYTKDGMKHRVNGPAMTIGDKEWFYINGYLKTPKEHATYKELYNNYETDTSEELYYTMADQSTTSIYTLSSTT